MKRNPQYEAGFVRQSDDEPSAEEIARAAAARARWTRFGVVLAVVAVSAAVVAGVVLVRRDDPSKQLARAKAHIAAGNHASAIIELKRSLQGRPANAEARFLLGDELWSYGDAKGAEIEYRKSLDLGLSAETGLVPLVRAELAQGKFDDVVASVNAAQIEAPDANAELQTMLGTSYLALGKYDAGMSAFSAARDLVPNFSGAAIAESRYLAEQGKFDEASAKLASVPADDKHRPELQALKGDIARALKKPAEAVVAYQLAIAANPRDVDAGIHLAQAYIDLQQYDLAQARIDIVAKQNPRNALAHYIRALTAYLRRDYPTANDAITQSVQLMPTNDRSQLLAGIIGVEVGQPVDAEKHLRESIRLGPPATEARKALVGVYMQRGEIVHANETLQPLLAGPVDPAIVTLAVKLAVLQGDAVRASSLFEQATSRQPIDVNTSLVGAALLMSAGRPDAGIARLNAAARAHPDNPELDAALVMAQIQNQRPDAALAAWQALDRKKPDSPRAYTLLAQIAMARKDVAAARKALDQAASLDPLYFPATMNLVALDLQAGQVEPARERLQKLVAADPHSVDAPLLLAHVEEVHGATPATVVALLRTAQARDPKSLQVIRETVAFFQRHDDAAAALAAAQQGLKIDANDQPLLTVVGDLQERIGPGGSGLSTLTRLAALNSENADYAVRLGLSQLAAGQSEPALDSFRNAFKDAPQRSDLQLQTVGAFIAAGKTEQATRTLFEVSQQSPNSPVIGELDADVKLASKQFPEALAGYRKALATTPSTRLAIKTYQAMMLAKQRSQANAVLTDWQTQHPDDTAMWLFDAQVAVNAKAYGRAARDFRKVLDKQPDDPAILNNLAWTLQQAKDPTALAFAEKANQLAPNNADFVDTLGGILVQQGQIDRGLGLVTQAASLAPHKLGIRLHLARVQVEGDRKDAARRTLKSLADEAPESAEGKESRALLSTL